MVRLYRLPEPPRIPSPRVQHPRRRMEDNQDRKRRNRPQDQRQRGHDLGRRADSLRNDPPTSQTTQRISPGGRDRRATQVQLQRIPPRHSQRRRPNSQNLQKNTPVALHPQVQLLRHLLRRPIPMEKTLEDRSSKRKTNRRRTQRSNRIRRKTRNRNLPVP